MASSASRSRSHQRGRWLVSYADLMTLLFAVFVVLFTAAQRRPLAVGAAGSASGRAETAAAPLSRQVISQSGARVPADAGAEALYSGLSNLLAPAAMTENISLQRLPKGVVVRMNEAGSFGTADARPLPAMRETLHHIALIAGNNGARIRVEGYTDDQPIHTAQFQSNWELSTARAQAVLALLLAEPGLDPANLSVAGYGPYHPLASNETEPGRRLNRRIELVVLAASDD